MPLLHRRQTPRRPAAGSWRALALPIAGGLCLAAAFPPLRLWPLVFLAWVPLWVRLERARPGVPRAFLDGWVMGMAAFPAMMLWLLGLSNDDVTIPGLMIPSLLLIGLYLGIFFGLAAAAAELLRRWTRLPIWVLAPAITTLVEFLRSLGPLGFPWGAPAYALARQPALLQLGASSGFWGLVLMVLAVNGLLAAAAGGRRWGLPAAVALLAAVALHGHLVLSNAPKAGGPDPRGPSLRVLVAQPDIRREIKWRPEKRDEVTAMILDHAWAAAERARATGGFDLFVWPETVFPLRLLDEAAVLASVQALVDSQERPFLIGTQEGYWRGLPEKPEWVAHNSVLVVQPGGERSLVHRKLRLVPFSERMPLQEIVPWLTSIDFGQSDFFPGEAPVILEAAGASIGSLICFESAFPDLARDFVRCGADLLVVITNDFWFGRTAGPAQHADMSILRAVENRVAVVRCANTGISMVIDPYGRVSHETEIFTPADFVAEVPLGAGCLAARHPDWLVRWLALGLLALCAAALVGTAGRWKRARRP